MTSAAAGSLRVTGVTSVYVAGTVTSLFVTPKSAVAYLVTMAVISSNNTSVITCSRDLVAVL